MGIRLNGWKRIGIIASVAWILGADVYTYNSELDRASALITSLRTACYGDLAGMSGDAWDKAIEKCDKNADELLAVSITNARFDSVVVAFVPVPLG